MNDDNNNNDNASSTTEDDKQDKIKLKKQQEETITNTNNNTPPLSPPPPNEQTPQNDTYIPSIFLSNKWSILLFGQILSLSLSLGGAMSAKLDDDNCHVGCPAFRLGLMYLGLCLLFMGVVRPVVKRRKGKRLFYCRRYDHIHSGSDYYDDNDEHQESHENHQGIPNGEGDTYENNDNNEIRMNADDDGNIEQEMKNEEDPAAVPYHHCAINPSSPSLQIAQSSPQLHSSMNHTITTNHNNNNTIKPPIPYLSYLLISFFDVQANYLTVLAFQYTTFNSITLFGSLAIPSSMIWSKILLKRRFTSKHVVAACICLCGVFINVYGDMLKEEEQDDSIGGNVTSAEYNTTTTSSATDDDNNNSSENNRTIQQQFIGDLSAIAGGILFGLNDVLAEKTVKYHNGCIEYLSYVGFFGMIVSIIQVLLVERMDVYNLLFHHASTSECPTSQIGIFLMLFVATNVFAYGGCSYFLIVSSAPMLNLSILTSDFWSVLFVVVEEHVLPNVLFWVALVLIVGGVCLYEMSPSSVLLVDSNSGGGGDLACGEMIESSPSSSSSSPRSLSEMTMFQMVEGGENKEGNTDVHHNGIMT